MNDVIFLCVISKLLTHSKIIINYWRESVKLSPFSRELKIAVLYIQSAATCLHERK